MDVIKRSGGVSEISRTGHVFFKAKMREKQAIYGGEMSAHHYFRILLTVIVVSFHSF